MRCGDETNKGGTGMQRFKSTARKRLNAPIAASVLQNQSHEVVHNKCFISTGKNMGKVNKSSRGGTDNDQNEGIHASATLTRLETFLPK
jgi:hypothetical protein